MRIGMILDKRFPNDARVENEAQALIKDGHQVYLFCLNYKNKKEVYNFNGIQVYTYPFSKYLFDKFSPLAFTIPLYHIYLQRKIKNFLKIVNPDVIHIHDMVAAKNIFKSKRKKSVPIVLDLHEDRPAIMEEYSHVNSGIGKYLIKLSKWEQKQDEYISKADKVIVVTEEAKSEIIKHGVTNSDKIVVVPNSIDLNTFTKLPLDKNIIQRYENYFVILYIGFTGIRRGTDTLIKSAVYLKESIPNLKIVIVGNSRDDNYLKEIAAKEKIDSIVDFEGWQKFSLLPSYIKASDICVSPLKRNKHHDTTYANKIFQYMAFGKAQVVSDSTAQANLIRKIGCGLVHEADSTGDLSEKILMLYKDSKLLKDMGARGQNALTNTYQWEKVNKELITFYSKLNN